MKRDKSIISLDTVVWPIEGFRGYRKSMEQPKHGVGGKVLERKGNKITKFKLTEVSVLPK